MNIFKLFDMANLTPERAKHPLGVMHILRNHGWGGVSLNDYSITKGWASKWLRYYIREIWQMILVYHLLDKKFIFSFDKK